MQNRRDFIKALSIGAAGIAVLPRLGFGINSFYTGDAWKTLYPQIVARIKPPTFAKRTFTITKFGAKADGAFDNTDAIARAIGACAKAGGGRVVVPSGTFLTAAIRLKSGVDLHVERGATLKFSSDASKYPIVSTRFEGMECMNVSPFIYAFDETNIAITGEGTLDGGADEKNWWPWHSDQKPARARLYKMMESGAPLKERVFGPDDKLRPNFIQPHNCKNVLIEGVTIVNSPMWELHPLLCENVTVRGVKVASHGPNNDGCDPESCRDVLIEDCTFDTGDDCIAIKSGRNEDGRRVNIPTENIIVRHCRMKDGHGGITVGSEISGGVRYLFAHDNDLDSPDLWTAIRVKNNAARGGVLEHFFYRDITVGRVARSVLEIDFNYEEGAKGKFTPVMRGLEIRGLKCTSGARAVDLQGFENAPIYDISLEDCSFGEMKNASIVKNVKGLVLKDVTVNGKPVTTLA